MNQPFDDATEKMAQKPGGKPGYKEHHRKKKEAHRAGGANLCRRCPEGLNTERGLEGAGEIGRRVRRQGVLLTKHTHGHTDIPGSASCVLNPVGRNSQVPQSPRRLITESLIKNTITEPMLHRERRHSDAERQGGRHTAGERQQQAVSAGGRAPERRAETPVYNPDATPRFYCSPLSCYIPGKTVEPH